MNIPLVRFVFKEGWVIIDTGGGYGIYRYSKKRKKYVKVWIEVPKEKKGKGRSKSAQQFIDALQEEILKTGVVKNVHKSYDPRHNKRYKVDPHRARVIAWRIAKAKGLRAGRKPPHLHKKK